jgi:hypothetical protein
MFWTGMLIGMPLGASGLAFLIVGVGYMKTAWYMRERRLSEEEITVRRVVNLKEFN